ncbi:S-layer homology domain-containing protein [Paenibacillus sp. HWE-109]|uniref:S-layer homology domain-containing protein n=1 Tax=Paenibacillus sp. HWE-109 TaxID=1306526 RepID=UPI001EDEDFD2|nr:S-layer homology domain-containing protein [Paenibacillus sp. HWE-109]UKS29685.1 S-layer homology domain-containing protein [Paenibacillus sp. HWE-109]
MKKSVLCLLIALFTFGTSFSQILPVYAAENDFTFTVGSNGATVTDYKGTDLNVVIPAEYAGTTVTEIGRSAFDTYGTGKPRITSVVIPNNVKVIQTYGFRYTSLTSIDLPDGLLTIGSSAFENNPLTTVVFPDSVTMIGNYSFYMNKLTSIKLSENLKTINGGAFDTNLITKLVIPAGVTSVASSSFYNNNLTSITVLGDATTFGTGVFAGNPSNLKIFGIANSPAAVYASSNGHTFVDGTALFQAVSSTKLLLKSYLVGTRVGQVPANAYNDLSADYDAAMLFIDGIGNATIASDLANAATPLISSIAAFNAQIVKAGNPAALASAIAAAQQALSDHTQGANVGQVSAGARTALQSATNAAQQILDNAGNYTQDQLDTAVSQINSAVQVFNAAVIQAGVPTALGAAITVAQQALTDHPQGVNVGQVSAGTRTALQSATNAAQQILDNAGNYTQDQLDTAVNQINSAVQVFNAAVLQTGIPTALGAAITAAQQALTDHPQGSNVGQTSAGTRTVLETAMNAAQQILDNAGNYTQAQLDTAVNQINSAVQVFNAAVIQAGVPTALGAAITAAQQALTDHPQGTNVGQTSAGTRTVLETAMNAAQQILDNAGNYTQAQLDTAVNQLNSAVQVFTAAVIQAGVPTALGAAITAAQQALTDHPQGTNVGQTSAGTRTVLETAMNAAQQILDNAGNYTQAQLDTAVNQLNSAVQVFNTAIIQAGVPTALGAAIAVAQQALTNHPQGTNVGQTSAGTRTALETAMDVAQQILENAGNYTQDQLDTAVNQINSAVQVFNAAVIQAGVPTALGAAITAAQQALTDHPQGTNVGQTSAGTRTALETAMDTAQQILDNAGNYTRDQLDTAVNQLNSAVQVFTAAVIQAGVRTALGAAITAAQQALTDHPEGTDVGQTSAGDRSALQTAIDAAQAIADDAVNQSQTRLDEATVSLNDAMAIFEAAWVGMVLTASANDLYGTSDTLRFTVFYGYEVTVTGTPVVPIMVGDNSVTQTVYAPYMGARGKAVRKLTFEFEVPAGLADVDGINVAASLELPNGASIVRTSSGRPASLTYVAPDASGIRIVAIPPEVALTVAPNGSERKAISVTASVYGAAAGNALTQLRWLPGSLSGVDFAGGTKGTDILATPQFTITANGDYTVYALDEAGNEAVKTITVTGISTPSSSDNGNRPVTSGTTVKLNPNGRITTLVDPSDIKQVKRSDGTVIEQVILPERTREQVLELLKDAKEPFVSITIGNREQAVQAQFQADWIADMVKAYPNTIIEVRLNDSSYQLRLSVIDLIGLAERLDAEISNMTVNIIQVLASEHIRQEIDRIGVSQGFAVFSDVIDYKVMVETNGQMLEVHDFGGSYSIRTIKLDREKTNRNLVAVQYIPGNGTVVFVPSKMETGPDGTNEAILNVPHNSLYTVVNVQARTFSDLSGHWAKADVEHLASKLLVNGVAADRFESEGTITRAEFSALLVRGLGLSVKESEVGVRFADVPASAWYASAVNAAVASGLVSGIGPGGFAPNDPITREQMAVVIAGALTFTSHGTGSDGQEGGHLDAFTDRDSISSWAQAAVVRASEDGIMNGMEDGRFAPREYVTRAQAAVILKRFLQYVHFID